MIVKMNQDRANTIKDSVMNGPGFDRINCKLSAMNLDRSIYIHLRRCLGYVAIFFMFAWALMFVCIGWQKVYNNMAIAMPIFDGVTTECLAQRCSL